MNAPVRLSPVIVAARERPFDGPVRVLQIGAAERMPSIAELLARLPDLPPHFALVCEARVNGVLVPREAWHRVRPRIAPGMAVGVTFTLPLRGPAGGGAGGSGGGQKNTIALVATIAVLLVAAAVTGGAAGGITGGVLAAGTVAASVAGAAVGIGGALAIAALTPPPTLANDQAQSAALAATTGISGQTGSAASLSGNALAPGAPVPRVIGTMRVFPQLLCNPLIEQVGDDQYAEAVFGLAGPHALSDIRVGNTKASDIDELDIEMQEGLPASPIQTLVTRQSKTVQPGIAISRHKVNKTTQYLLDGATNVSSLVPQWHSVVSRDSPDEIWITIQWPEGLLFPNALSETPVAPVRIRIRKRGDVTWINLPEVMVKNASPVPFAKVFRIHWADAPAALNLPPSDAGPIYAFKSVPAQNLTPATAGWTAHSHFSAGAGNNYLAVATIATTNVRNVELFPEKAIFYLDEATFPKGVYEVQIRIGVSAQYSLFSPAAYTTNFDPGVDYGASTWVVDFFESYIDNFNYRIWFDQAIVHDKSNVVSMSSVWNDNPVQSRDFATISVRVHNRQLDNLSVLASGYVLDWDGSNWATVTTTSNPAPHLYDVLTGTLGGSPMPLDIVDSAGLVAWRQHCIDLGYECNAALEGKTYLDAASVICSSGYARLAHSEKWGVFLDKDRGADSPIQIFTPRNMKGFSWTRAFAKRPTGIRASFINADIDYVRDESITYDTPSDPDGSQLEQIQYDGLVTTAEVDARAAFDLAQSRLRFTFYKGEADLEALVCQRGDLVGVQYDILAQQAGFARIKSVTTLAGNVTGLVLEGTVPMMLDDAWSSTAAAWSSYSSAWLAARHGIAIRLKGGNGIIVKQVTALVDDEVQTVTFSTPFPDPGTSQLDADCLCATGPLGSEYRRLIVFGVQPSPDMTANLTFVDEAPSLWSVPVDALLTEDGLPILTEDGLPILMES